MITHALTIDLEDWHQLVRRRVTGSVEPASAAVVHCTHRLLDLLDATNVRATFFVVGLVAEAYPGLVREVAARGHEIGSHTHNHRLIHSMTPVEFRDEMRGARNHLQDLTGQPVLGFRAPEFSVKELGHWCFDVLKEVGFAYDSSVFPAHARYGIPTAPRRPFEMQTRFGSLMEFPLATWELGGQRLAVAGGSYFRVLPAVLLGRALRALSHDHVPAVLYFHPYEFHDAWLHLAELSPWALLNPGYAKHVVLHNLFTSRITLRLRGLLQRFQFAPLGDLHERWRSDAQSSRGGPWQPS